MASHKPRSQIKYIAVSQGPQITLLVTILFTPICRVLGKLHLMAISGPLLGFKDKINF